MKRRQYAVLVLTATLILGTISVAQAAEMMKMKGQDVYIQETVSKVKLADGRTMERHTLKGFSMADDPKSPFAMINQDCAEAVVISPDGSVSSGGYCNGVDADGHVYWVSSTGDQKGGTWSFTGGTGKFAGIKGGGTFAWSTQWSDGKAVSTWEGNWTTK